MSETDKTERGNFSALSLFPIVPDQGEKEDRVQENKNKTQRYRVKVRKRGTAN